MKERRILSGHLCRDRSVSSGRGYWLLYTFSIFAKATMSVKLSQRQKLACKKQRFQESWRSKISVSITKTATITQSIWKERTPHLVQSVEATAMAAMSYTLRLARRSPCFSTSRGGTERTACTERTVVVNCDIVNALVLRSWLCFVLTQLMKAGVSFPLCEKHKNWCHFRNTFWISNSCYGTNTSYFSMIIDPTHDKRHKLGLPEPVTTGTSSEKVTMLAMPNGISSTIEPMPNDISSAVNLIIR